MKLDVYNLANEKVGEVDVDPKVFDAPAKPHLHHLVVKAQLAKRRAGTAKVKTRGEVKGSTHKMYRQKGTGRARHSTTKVNTSVGGGVAHGPSPRSYAIKVPKKMRRAALCSVLSGKVRAGTLKILEDFSLAEIKSKTALGHLQSLAADRALVVDDKGNEQLRLSVRNLADYKYLAADGLNVADALRFDNLLLTRAALEQIQGRLA